ncbi:glycoside hydrolase family 43 protein [Lacticaseibacillus suihuaensis]
MRLDEINVRDPYVLVDHDRYYLYGTRGATTWGPADGFDGYVSSDLSEWLGPVTCFQNRGDFWATENYWAPEVSAYGDRFVMLATFKAPGRARGTQILVADRPLGPFKPLTAGPVTPPDWECLDGTLWVENGTPYLVFCHEWLQARDGTICVQELSVDLTRAIGAPQVLFHGSEGVGVTPFEDATATKAAAYVTDGPFLVQRPQGLFMLWSSYGEGKYLLLAARSDTESVLGPWRQCPVPVFGQDGGHAMVFETLAGQALLTLHAPNDQLRERPHFYPFEIRDGQPSISR